MSNVFNAAEVIDMGIEKEKKRRDFYGKVAVSFNDKDMKDLFSKLRDWEETHIKKFSEIRDSVVGDMEVTETYEGEFESYMKTLIDDKFYAQVSPAEFDKNVKKPIDAIRYGISFEKDAILFFGELLSYMSGENTDKVRKLIDEEKQHIIYLTELKRKYEI